jgi:protein TonB
MPQHTLAAEEQTDLVSPAETGVADAVAVQAVDEPGSASPRLLTIAIVTSLSLHAAAAAAVLVSTVTLPEYGVLAEDNEAISVEITQTAVLEAVEATPLKDAASKAATAMQPGQARPAETEPETIKASEVAPDQLDTTEDPLEVLRGAAAPAEQVQAKTHEPAKKVRNETQRTERPGKQPKKKRHAPPQMAGGATARANAAKAATSGRVSASRGSIVSYAARVRSQVARHKPPGRGPRGTARVSFGVSRSGGLAYARLTRSSGSAALDRAAVAAVRRAAPFGAPPAGASAAQLRFSIPFYFR